MGGNRRQVPTKAPKWMLIEYIYGDKAQKRDRYDELMRKCLEILRDMARENAAWTYKRELDVSERDTVRALLLPRVQLERRFETLEGGRDGDGPGKNPEAAADMKESLAIVIKRAWNCFIEEEKNDDATNATAAAVSMDDHPSKEPTHDWTNIVLRRDPV